MGKGQKSPKQTSFDDPQYEIQRTNMRVSSDLLESLYNLANQISLDSQFNPKDLTMFKVRFKEINNYKGDFQGAYNYLRSKCLDSDLQSELDTQLDEFYDKYYSVQVIADSLGSIPESNTQSTNEKKHLVKSQQFSLPKISLQQFSGSYTDWPNFIAMFDSLIHNNCEISGVQKMHYLLSILQTEPLSLIKHLELSETNYQIAYSLLKERYENKRLIADRHLESILAIGSLNPNQINSGLRRLVNCLKENIQALSALGFETESWSFILLHITIRKLPIDLRGKFELEHYKTSSSSALADIPTFNNLISFLETQLRVLETVSGTKGTVSSISSTSISHIRPSKSFIVNTSYSCSCCKGEHNIYICEKFNAMTPEQRKEFVIKNKLCFNCLRSHSVKKCQSHTDCRICHKRHHTKLHINFIENRAQDLSAVQPSVNEVGPVSHSSTISSPLSNSIHKGSTMLLGTAVVGIQDVHGHMHAVRALLDSGSQVTIITENLAQRLNLPRLSSTVLFGLGESSGQRTYGSMECSVHSFINGSTPALITQAVILKRITGALPSAPISSEVIDRCKDLVLADAKFSSPGPIDMLIGIDLFNLVFDGRKMKLGESMPTAHASIFGWVLMGQAPINSLSCQHITALSCTVDLDSILSRFWEVEEPPAIVIQDPENIQCEKHFLETHTRDVTGRFIVRLPFKVTQKSLGSTFDTALRRFNVLERKLQRDPRLRELYNEFMSDYLASGHMRPISGSVSSERYYIPHHGVLKESSSTTKLRAVFDASSPSSSGVSLNQLLMPGPKLQQDIQDIILRFRTHRVVFICDIKQMYRCVRLHANDCRFQTILWRESPDQPIQQFELTTVTYGVSSSAYLAIRVIHELASLNAASYPAAARALKEDIFVDDIISGSDCTSSARLLQQQVVDVLAQGGFLARKWISNCDETLEGYPTDHLEKPFRFEETGDNIFKILGVEWNSRSDSFVYRVSSLPSCKTKRQILSNIARIYDPCGYLTPITFYLKVLMQRLWLLELSWDDPLPEEFSKLWDSFVEGFKLLQFPCIPRFIFGNSIIHSHLMGFCDASQYGYAAVAYLRTTDSSGEVAVHLLLAKSRVAPIKQKLTIPRLELCGAVLLSRLLVRILSVLSARIDINCTTAWCDSTIALAWLRTPPHLLQIFEGNRVSQVQGLVPFVNWRHVPSALNPADCASRGLVATDLANHPLWWSPSWLKDDPSTWPSDSDEVIEEIPGLKPPTISSLTVAQVQKEVLSNGWLERFSSWSRLQRTTAWIIRFAHNSRSNDKLIGALSTKELDNALYTIVKLAQHTAFESELKALHCKRSLKGPLTRLNIFIDFKGLLRVGGRLRHSSLPTDARHPILLPKVHHLTNLIVDYYHKQYLHAGPSTLMNIVRQRFWIPSARRLIRHRIFKCVKCYRLRAKALEPFMGDLPASRVRQARPFQRVGVDFAGPFFIRSSTARKAQRSKAYLCVFVCLVVKAVHLEVVSDLTSDAFMACLHRFVSRRGAVTDIYSDCGKNFQGAKRHLREVESFLAANQQSLKSSVSNFCINWHMNPPYAPHMGGLWESMVKSAKQTFYRTIGEQVLTFEELTTVFTRVEAVLNSRPLCPLSSDVDDLDVLTPGHFLIGQSLISLPEYDFDHTPISPLKRWKLVQQISQHFWQRWHREYLLNLQQRSKWCKKIPNIKVGDLVLIMEDNLPPLRWKLGRVCVLHPGADGIVRVVEIKTNAGSCLRAVTKLCPLPECDN